MQSAIASPIGKYPIDVPFKPHLELFRHTIRLALYGNAE